MIERLHSGIARVIAMPALAAAMAVAAIAAPAAHAQPVDLPIPAATTDQYPPGVSVRQTAKGPVYADARGRTLYGMDMRTLVRWSADAAQYCQGPCAETWQPMLAPADAKPNVVFPRGFGERPRPAGAAATPGALPAPPAPARGGANAVPPGFIAPQSAPDWTIIQGPQGPQWVYKGWHMVYTRKGERPGGTAYDGSDNFTWNTLKFVPPAPKLAAPSSVSTQFIDGAYALTDKNGRVLFTGICAADCHGWLPLAAPMAGKGFGEWAISLASDTPQWTWRGKPVFISQEDSPVKVPPSGTVLRP
jgi:predicted lipoprotein with Yx(FWY)xxD motif